jgi:Zn finger protein HypA/HybF involved in hydrogenase expression
MERWWCMDCKAPVMLDKHGRCSICESEAVDLLEHSQEALIREVNLPLPVPSTLQRA